MFQRSGYQFADKNMRHSWLERRSVSLVAEIFVTRDRTLADVPGRKRNVTDPVPTQYSGADETQLKPNFA
jgi:hypothetical protein